jgi:hypothetical protein
VEGSCECGSGRQPKRGVGLLREEGEEIETPHGKNKIPVSRNIKQVLGLGELL